MRIDQWTPSLVTGAAYTNDVLALQAQLGGRSSSRIVVGRPVIDPGLGAVIDAAIGAHPWRVEPDVDGAVLVLHCGILDPAVEDRLITRLVADLDEARSTPAAPGRSQWRIVLRPHRSSGWQVAARLPGRLVGALATSATVASNAPRWLSASSVGVDGVGVDGVRVDGVGVDGSIAMAVAGPLLPIDSYQSVAGTGANSSSSNNSSNNNSEDGAARCDLLVDQVVQRGDGIDAAITTAHLLRSHRNQAATLTHLGWAEDSDRFDGLVRMAAQLRLHRRWLGAPAHGAVLDSYRHATVLVALGVDDHFPAAAVQAMAAGVPVVGFATPVMREVLGDAAVLIDPGEDRLVLVEALAAVAERSELRRWLIHRGASRAQQHAPQLHAASALALLRGH